MCVGHTFQSPFMSKSDACRYFEYPTIKIAMRIPIAFSTDHNYVMQTGVCLYSLLKHAQISKYDIFVIINEDVNDDDKEALRTQVDIFEGHSLEFIEIGDVFKDAFEIRGISTAAYSRLLIPWLLPQYDYVLYSDVDIIFKMDLDVVYRDGKVSDKLISGVVALGFRINRKAHEYPKTFDIEPNKYINSGLLVFNCRQFRAEGLKNRILEEAKKRYTFQDQDILNIICKDRIHYLSPKYNLPQYSLYFFCLSQPHDVKYEEYYGNEEMQKDWLSYKDCIIHYAGTKPWNTFTYAWRIWWDAYAASIFYNPEYECRVTRSIMLQSRPRFIIKKILLRMYHTIIDKFK